MKAKTVSLLITAVAFFFARKCCLPVWTVARFSVAAARRMKLCFQAWAVFRAVGNAELLSVALVDMENNLEFALQGQNREAYKLYM